MKIAVIGATGFIGSAFEEFLITQNLDVVGIGRSNYDSAKNYSFDVVINSSNNSKKYIADREPFVDFDLSVKQQIRVLQDFPADLHILLSSVDVYSNLDSPRTTTEDIVPDVSTNSHYGFHKYLAEQCVQHYSPKWLIFRLAGMVGPNLKKNPVFDILNGRPIRIHPESEYQFMHTADVASIVWKLAESGIQNEVTNVCGNGMISPRIIAQIANRELDLSELPEGLSPRNVRISNEKLARLVTVPSTESAIRRYLSESSE